jgi:hypothetical protein
MGLGPFRGEGLELAVIIDGYAEISAAGEWRFTGEMIPNPERKYDPNVPELIPRPLFESGQKELAAILTGLYASIRATEPYMPVAPLRGLPDDLSPELAGWLRLHDGKVGFAANWFTKHELDMFGWEERLMRRQAMVEPRFAALFAGCPRGFPFAKWPKDVPITYAGQLRDGIEVEWIESYAEIVPEFCRDAIPQLSTLGPADHVRLVVAAFY